MAKGFGKVVSGLKSVLKSGASAAKNAAKSGAEFFSGAKRGQAYQKKAESHAKTYTEQSRTHYKIEEPETKRSDFQEEFYEQATRGPIPVEGTLRERFRSKVKKAFELFKGRFKRKDPFDEEPEPPFYGDTFPPSPPPPGDGPPPPFPEPPGGGDDVDEWLHSGRVKIVDGSSNVYAISYDIIQQALYIQYKHWEPGMDWMNHEGPGATYAYAGVDENEAYEFYKSASKGGWVWDRLRVHGSWGGHQKPMSLMKVESGYVPRQSFGKNWWDNRTDSEFSATLPPKRAIPLAKFAYWRRQLEKKKNNASPDRGKPDRGTPDNGRPRSYRPNNGRL